MNRTTYFLEMSLISGIIGIISEQLLNLRVSYVILLVLLILDTVTGIARALKYSRFSLKGAKKLVRKMITYSTAIFTVRLFEIGIEALVKTTLASQVMAAFLVLSEAASILENLALLGVPIPSRFISLLLGNLKLPGIGKSLIKSVEKEERYLNEIDEIITYQLPTFENKCMRALLEIKFNVWKDIAIQFDNMLTRGGMEDELLYYKSMTLIQTGLQEMEEKWEEADISRTCIDNFNRWHRPKVENWLGRVKDICYSNQSLYKKKRDLIDSIIIILYQTIVDARKGMDNIKG